jgi:hypothetical protein
MAMFRKKPVVIEAFQLTKETRESNEHWPSWARIAWNKDYHEEGALYPHDTGSAVGPLAIMTKEGVMRANYGDWIIQGVKGEIYPCKPDIFEATYEPV